MVALGGALVEGYHPARPSTFQVREARTSHINNCSDPKWKDELQISLGPGTARPPLLRFYLLDRDAKKEDDIIAIGETDIGTAPTGKEKLFLKGQVITFGKVEKQVPDVKFQFAWSLAPAE